MNLQEFLEQSTQCALANAINQDGAIGSVTQGAVSQWLKKGVPASRVLQLERVSQGQMSRYELRPDLYPQEEVVAA